MKQKSAGLFGLAAVIAFSAAFVVPPASTTPRTGVAPLPTPQQIDSYVTDGMKDLHIPGAAVAVFANGRITHVTGLGMAQAGRPVTPQTPFQLGSVSKSFTALVVLQLADEGRLSLDDPLSKHLPSFRMRDKAVSDQITVRQLLNHRSGLSTLDGNRNQATTYRGTDAMARAAGELGRATLQSTPGEDFAYSNANYALLAWLIETVDGRPFEDAMETRIFAPLSMRNSFVQTPKPGSALPAVGHTQWFGRTVERDFVAGRMMSGPGGVTASAEDLATYLVAVFERDPRIIPASLSEALSRERRGGYEFGWEFGTFGGRKMIFHGGLNPGFLSKVAYDPARRQGVLVLTNMSGSLEGNLPGGAVSYVLGLPAENIAPPWVNLLRLWGGLGLLALLLTGGLLSIRNLLAVRATPNRQSRLAAVMCAVIPSAALLGLSFFLTVMVPQFSGVNLTAVYMFYPDVAVVLGLSSIVAAIWAVLRAGLIATRRRRPSEPSEAMASTGRDRFERPPSKGVLKSRPSKADLRQRPASV